MPITLIATIGSPDANSYVATLAEARAYAIELAAMTIFGLTVDAIDAMDDATLTRMLTLAASSIDASQFPGVRQTVDQAREWPRVRTGLRANDGVIPEGMKLAQVAEVMVIAAEPSKADVAIQNGIASESFGNKSVSFDLARAKASRGMPGVSSVATQIMVRYRLVSAGGSAAGSVYMPRM